MLVLFLILAIGVLMFVFYHFEKPPLNFIEADRKVLDREPVAHGPASAAAGPSGRRTRRIAPCQSVTRPCGMKIRKPSRISV